MKQTIIVQAIIKKDQRVLLLQKKGVNVQSQTYELPWSVVGYGHDPHQVLSSAIFNQVGYNIQISQLVDVVSTHVDDDHIIALVFLVSLEPQSEKLSLDPEYEQYKWVELSKIQQFQVSELTRKALDLQTSLETTEVETESRAQAVVSVTTENKNEVIVYTDGGSRGNPGPSAAGFVILNDKEELLFEGGKYLGITTNNQAEYQAVKLGLEKAYELGARVVKFKMDSLLIVNQMLGIYQIKNRDLWPIYTSIKLLVKKFDKVTFTHVRREFNKEADALVNKVLDEHR